jgi:hypothetical protein
MAIAAVITADIVHSTQLTGAMGRKLAGKLRSVLASYRFEFYRGDSFQVYIKEPGNALTVVLCLRAAARTIGFIYDVRASIGIGQVRTHFRELSTATGEAFTLSGRGFDEISKTENRMIMRSSNKPATSSLKIMAYFIDYIFKGLTPKQAEVLLVLLAGNTQQEAARKLKKSQSTVNKHAQSAGWNELVKLSEEFRELVLLNT